MRIDIMTLFPDTVGDMMNESILGRAQERELIRIEAWRAISQVYSAVRRLPTCIYPVGLGANRVRTFPLGIRASNSS